MSDSDAILVTMSEGPQKPQLQRYLDTNGDGTGTKNAKGNYAAARTIFFIQPPPGQIYRINRMLVSIEDAPGFQPDEYGSTGAALGNGIEVRTVGRAGIIDDLTDAVPVKTNAQWAMNCFDVDFFSWGAAPADELLTVRWTFGKSGQMIRLVGDRNERLEVICHDNLSGLIAHYFKINGYREH